ncbi:MAG: GrpB family protein, partial [Chloroflexota bacterium]|nr:GrpB family protein [Chloroflexota bacterium]
LAAKPILDLIGALRDLGETAACIEPLRRLGYTYVPEYEAEMPERRYFRRGAHSARTHHLHLYAPEEFLRQPQRLFRDYLRAHRDVAADYARLKRHLAARYGADRVGYTDAKSTFIRAVVDQARACASPEARRS